MTFSWTDLLKYFERLYRSSNMRRGLSLSGHNSHKTTIKEIQLRMHEIPVCAHVHARTVYAHADTCFIISPFVSNRGVQPNPMKSPWLQAWYLLIHICIVIMFIVSPSKSMILLLVLRFVNYFLTEETRWRWWGWYTW